MVGPIRRLLFKAGYRGYIRATFLADFLTLPIQRMKSTGLISIRHAVLAMIVGVTGTASAQWDDFGSSGTGTDTASTDSTASTGTSFTDLGWGEEKKNEPQMPVRKPYVRFNPPYDSMREIIYYEGIIEDENCEFCTADSLYYRAKKYIMSRFGKEQVKKFTVEDITADRITMRITVPMTVKYGEYKKFESGMLEYKVTLRFKDFRYRYQFGNFVHIESPNGLAKDATRTYHEYYMKVKKGYQNTDQFLLAADREVKEFVDGLKKSLKEPYQPDEDDW